jgi:hypothetical protein
MTYFPLQLALENTTLLELSYNFICQEEMSSLQFTELIHPIIIYRDIMEIHTPTCFIYTTHSLRVTLRLIGISSPLSTL